MNFTTDLPKKRPYVTYIVASAVKCEKFFPDSKNEGPSFRMHAVILNKDGMQTQKYKSKIPHHSTNEDPSSTKSPSLIDGTEADRGDITTDDVLDFKKASPKKDDKSYILCHIRKIDHNYKALKSSGKRRSSYDEDEEEDEEDLESEESPLSKKIIIEQKSANKPKIEEETKSMKDNSHSNSLRYDTFTSHSRLDSKSENIQSNSSAFHTINPINNISFSFREKKGDQSASKINPSNVKEDIEVVPTVNQQKTTTEIKSVAGKESAKSKDPTKASKDLSLIANLHKENNENYDYFKLFNVLVNLKES
jgi:hypothetical protein